MSIHVRRTVLVYDSITMIAFEPQYNRPDAKRLQEYMKHNPVPEDPAYSSEDLRSDLLIGTGFLELPLGVTDEMMSYVSILVNEVCV